LKYTIKKKHINNKEYIFDPIRKKYLINTPEEWIRQNFIHYLHTKKGFPLSLMSSEKSTIINNQNNRSDIVCYNTLGKPILVVECKSEKVNLNPNVFEQAQNYNSVLKAKYVIITNGKKTLCFYINKKATVVKKIPNYLQIQDLK
tara:strand:- start:1908 stop:2342 length:435 start_codon:yes stop_codon:yes gene_type:complete